jgi:hypothetical protein
MPRKWVDGDAHFGEYQSILFEDERLPENLVLADEDVVLVDENVVLTEH